MNIYLHSSRFYDNCKQSSASYDIWIWSRRLYNSGTGVCCHWLGIISLGDFGGYWFEGLVEILNEVLGKLHLGFLWSDLVEFGKYLF